MVLGSNPAAATSLWNFGNSVFAALPGLSEETLKEVGPFYLVSMPGEIKDPTTLEMCNLSWTPPLIEDNCKNNPVHNNEVSVLHSIARRKGKTQLRG